MEPVTSTIIKESVARWVLSPSGEPISITLLKGHRLNRLLTTYCYSHRFGHLSNPIREASFCSNESHRDPQLSKVQRRNCGVLNPEHGMYLTLLLPRFESLRWWMTSAVFSERKRTVAHRHSQ